MFDRVQLEEYRHLLAEDWAASAVEEVLYSVSAEKELAKAVKVSGKAVVEAMEEMFLEQSLVEVLQSLGGWL